MRGRLPDRRWRSRLLGGVALGVVAYVVSVWLDFEPRPVPFAVMAAVVCTLVWLLLDTVDLSPARWRSALPPAGDRVDEATSDVRILTSHQQASEPSDAVRDRLVALAAARDPVLADALRAEIEPHQRLSPAQIDRILTRIEEARDRS